MALKFNIPEMMSDLRRSLYTILEQSLDVWEEDVKKFMNPELVAKFKAEVKASPRATVDKIILYLEANPGALADSYGTGSKMDTSNPYFNEYFSDANRGEAKGNINRGRTGTEIVGRTLPKYPGKYTDIFGNEHTVKNDGFAGVPIEGNTFKNEEGQTITIEATEPTHAIKTGTDLAYDHICKYFLKEAVRKLKLSKYITEENVK